MPGSNTEQIIKEHFKTLSKPVKDAITSFDWAKEVFDVGRKYNLHVDDIGELQTEVMLVVLGLTSPRDFENEVYARIEKDEEKGAAICDEINTKVFLRIRDFMKNYYAEEDKKGKEIISSERKVLQGAGISLGDEPEEEIGSKDEEQFVTLPNAPDFAPKKVPPTPAPAIPDIKSKLEKSAVFASKQTSYLDPYREAIE